MPVASDWFDVYRDDPNLYALLEPRQWEEVISHLIVGCDRALLFDTGLGMGDLHAVVSALTDRPIAALNSHTHGDHVGGNHAFAQILALDLPYSRGHARGTIPRRRGRPSRAERFLRAGRGARLGGVGPGVPHF